MAALPRLPFSRLLRPSYNKEYICRQCLPFSTSVAVQSGHSRWSKIKHEKGAADKKKSRERSDMVKAVAFAVKMSGPNPDFNPRLAMLLAQCKKAGMPKPSVEAAIARGQGKSASGAALESVTVEIIAPPSIALIVDAESDNKNRSMQELRLIVKEHGGSVTPTGYLFTKKGRVLFEKDENGRGVDDVLDEVIEAGAEDVEMLDEEGEMVVWTEPNKTMGVAEELGKSLGLKVKSSEIVWDANEDTRVKVDDEGVLGKLGDLVAAIGEQSDVQGVYCNAAQGKVGDEAWEEFMSKLEL